jgi:hypothetical protein
MKSQLIKILMKVIKLNILSNNICVERIGSSMCRVHIYNFYDWWSKSYKITIWYYQVIDPRKTQLNTYMIVKSWIHEEL